MSLGLGGIGQDLASVAILFLFLCLVLPHSRLDKPLYERDGHLLVERKVDPRLCGHITRERPLVLLYDRRTNVEPYVRLLKAEPGQPPLVVVVRDSVADALLRGWCRLPYRSPNLAQFGPRLSRSCRNVLVYVSRRFVRGCEARLELLQLLGGKARRGKTAAESLNPLNGDGRGERDDGE